MKRLVEKTLVVTLTVGTVLLICLAAYSVRWVLILAAIGIGLGILMAPPLRWLHRKTHLPYGGGALLFLTIWFGGIFGLGYLIYLLGVKELGPMTENIPQTLSLGRDRLADLTRQFPSISQSIRKIDWGALFQQSASTIFQGFKLGTAMIAFLFYLMASSLYVATNSREYLHAVLTLVPRRQQPKTRRLMNECASSLRHWFVAQLIAMACVGACASIGFIIIGLDYWLPLGILTGVLDIVPFVGPTIACLCALLVTLGTDPGKVPWVLVNFVVVEHIESNLVIPMVMKGQIELPPVMLLTFMLILGDWFGLLGVLIAPPLLTVLRTLYVRVYIPSVNSEPIVTASTELEHSDRQIPGAPPDKPEKAA